jgi:hypothetical protein
LLLDPVFGVSGSLGGLHTTVVSFEKELNEKAEVEATETATSDRASPSSVWASEGDLDRDSELVGW